MGFGERKRGTEILGQVLGIMGETQGTQGSHVVQCPVYTVVSLWYLF